jgi:hypothetical protein
LCIRRCRLRHIIPVLGLVALSVNGAAMLLIDDFSRDDRLSGLGTHWRLVTDRVMGGVSTASMSREQIGGRRALCLRGEVSLENSGGFVQLNLDLSPAGYLDAGRYTGVWIVVRGNDASYNLHLKSADVRFPWQSYRHTFPAGTEWRDIRLPFRDFEPHRIGGPLDTSRLSRLALVAIGRAFSAELCVARVGLY